MQISGLQTSLRDASPSTSADVAIKSLTVGGRVEYAQILAGYSNIFRGQNADAQIGAVSVGGDWIASSILAGINPVDGKIGNDDDTKLTVGADYGSGPTKDVGGILSKIASVVIKGGVFGTPVIVTDCFGFVAEQIGSFKVAGTTIPLTAGKDAFALGAGRSTATSDSFEVHILEV